MFKRRDPRNLLARTGRLLWPRGGWFRALTYVAHRVRRLPDPAYKISRGIAAGVFTCFTPLFGLHFLISAGLAWIMGGNVLAALLATFFGNPVTFPIIAGMSVELGNRMLGRETHVPLWQVFDSFSRVSIELWLNLKAVFTSRTVRWTNLEGFFDNVFLPYLVGGLIPGIVAGIAAYMLSRPIIGAYQKSRTARLKARVAKRREQMEERRAEKEGEA